MTPTMPGMAAGSSGTHAGQDECVLVSYNSQILPVHAAVLNTGKLLYFSGSGNDPVKFKDRRMEARLWDPTAGTIQRVPTHADQRDLFCTGHCFLPDGRLLVAGGNSGYPISPWLPLFTGIRDAFVFDPVRETWLRTAYMSDGRWYPTCVPLPDGRVAAFSGLMANPWKLLIPPFSLLNKRVEVWSPSGSEPLAGADTMLGRWDDLRADRRIEYYPRVHIILTGEILRVGPERHTLSFDPASRVWRRAARLRSNSRFQGTSVLLPLLPPTSEVRILHLGGSRGDHLRTKSTNSAEILQRTQDGWSWRWTRPMTFRRRHVNATLLLDGRVLVTGGGRRGNEDPIFETEIFDPRTETWALGATCHVGRLYHSVAALLPDGRVWTGGGNPGWGDDELRIELYTPGYWADSDRPRITVSPDNISYGSLFEIQVASHSPIVKAALVRPSSVTHSFNVEQRWVGVEITSRGSGVITLHAPSRPQMAPPGWYMLTVLDEERRPSRARWVHLAEAIGP